MLVAEQLMQPAACYRTGKGIDTPCLSKELVVVSSGLLVKIEYLFPTELESAWEYCVLKQLSRLMFKNLFNYKQASSEKNYGLAKILSEEKKQNRDLYT